MILKWSILKFARQIEINMKQYDMQFNYLFVLSVNSFAFDWIRYIRNDDVENSQWVASGLQ